MSMRWFLIVVISVASGVAALVIAIANAREGPVGFYSRVVLFILLIGILAGAISLMLLRTRWREAVANAWLVLISSVSAYLACDLVLGALLLPTYSRPSIPDAIVHHRYATNTTSLMVRPEYDLTITTNNLGLRGSNVETRKRPGVCRILVMGDSFTFGTGVKYEQTYAALLERELNEDSARAIQVLNAGVESYSPILEYLFLKNFGAALKPDIVVLALDQGDPVQEQYYRSLARFDKDRVPLAVDGMVDYQHARPEGIVARWIASHMWLGSWVVRTAMRSHHQQAFEDAVERTNRDLLGHTLKAHAADYSSAWRGVFESISLAYQFSRTMGSGFVLVTYPWGHQVSAQEWSKGRRSFLPERFEVSDRNLEATREFAAREGIPLLDLFPAFRGHTGEKKLFYDVDMHWTPAGHELAAAQLEEFLKAGRLGQWCNK